ncbi:MAG: hypothetical protein AAGK21_09030 [Bacteroidota bacterium]
MIDRIRYAFALRAVREAVASRHPQPLPADVSSRRVLLILPRDEDGQRATWDFVRSIRLDSRCVIPVGFGSTGVGVPDAFAGAVRILGDDELDWRRLPKPSALESVWTQRPDVVVCVADATDLGVALLAGGSPAAVRLGRHSKDREGCFDLMVRGATDATSAVASMAQLLRQLDPPILPL